MSEGPVALGTAEAVERLLATHEEEALERALAAAPAGVAAAAVTAAPSLEQKTRLLWAMEDRHRREALDLVPAPVVAALVQNLEEDNRYLLGDLSLEQFASVLALCSSERKYYWVVTALSFTDARANALPLLLPTRELAEILLTRAEFEEHLRAIADYPIESARIPAEMMADPAQAILDLVGPQDMLRVFPVPEPGLAHVLQTLLDYDPDRYVDLVRAGLRGADYAEAHPLEWEALTEDPVLLESLPSAAPGGERGETDATPGEAIETTPTLALVPVTAPLLVRIAAALPPAVRAHVGQELQRLYVREAIAEGGSFLLSDLERVARRVEGYLLLGLRRQGSTPEETARAVEERPLHRIAMDGARQVEGLRQVALRLAPNDALLDPEARALVRSLRQPRMTVNAAGEPRLLSLPPLPEELDVDAASARLEEAAAWIDLARAIGLARTQEALAAAGSVPNLARELALGAVLYARIEPGLAEANDRRRYLSRYPPAPDGGLHPRARLQLRRTVDPWARARGIDAEAVLSLLERALEGLPDAE